MDEEAFQRNLEHARAGYANAQEVVRFVDSKSAILTGVITVTTGIPFALLQVLVSSESPRIDKLIALSSSYLWAVGTATILVAMGILCGALSLLSSTSGLMARQPASPGSREMGLPKQLFTFLIGKLLGLVGRAQLPTGFTGDITSLFPLFPPHRVAEAQARFSRLALGQYDRSEILAEYAYQLGSIGRIIDIKIERNKDSVRWFELQAVCYGLGALATVTVLFFGWL